MPALDVSAPASARSPVPRGDETILVVEDEDGVRALVIKVLEDLGYCLLQAQSGPRALDVWREHRPGIDMLITDVVMPDGMNGIQLAERLRRISPSLKVIYTSGYLADVSRDDIPSRETDAATPWAKAGRQVGTGVQKKKGRSEERPSL